MSLRLKEYLLDEISDAVALEAHRRLSQAVQENDEEGVIHALPQCAVLFVTRVLISKREHCSPLLQGESSFFALFVPSYCKEGTIYADLSQAHEDARLGDVLILYTLLSTIPHNRELFCTPYITLLLESKDLSFTTEAFATIERLQSLRLRSGCFRLRSGTVVLTCVGFHCFKEEALRPYSALIFEHSIPAYW